MTDIATTISQFVEQQFPNIYREEGEVIVAFIKAYYEYLESNGHLINREMFDIRDIDSTYDRFLAEFQKKYLEDFPFVSATDTRYLVKNIMDLYRSKGSDESIKLLMRLLYNEDVEVYYPSQDILRVSDSLWVDPKYVEVISSERSLSFVNKKVFGSVSGATAFVDAIVTKRSNNRLIDILYLSDVQGRFVFGDIISDDGVLTDAPRVIGSLTEVEITSTSSDSGGNKVGDQFDVISAFGKNGKAVVSQIVNAANEVQFQLVDGGYGYTLDDNTKVLISDLMIIRDNSNTVFEVGDTVTQRVEKITLEPSTNQPLYNSVENGDTIQGLLSSNAAPIDAVVLRKDVEVIDNAVYPYLKIQLEDDQTFLRNQLITFNTDTFIDVGNEVKEESSYTIRLSAPALYEIGETVYQRQFLEGTSNTVSSVFNFGTVASITGNTVNIDGAFGNFVLDLDLVGINSGHVGDVITVTKTSSGTGGVITAKNSNTEYVVVASGTFDQNKKLRVTETGVLSTISSSTNLSVETISFNSLEESNFSVSNTFFTGTVIDQNSNVIKIATIENEFEFVSGVSVISSNSAYLTVNQIDSGSGANFKIGTLTNTETVTLTDETVSDLNVQGVSYYTVLVNGQNSGVGVVDTITVTDGGSGYSNTSTVTFSGGGYFNQNPVLEATAAVQTDANGSITSVTVLSRGEGYYTPPTIVVSDGSDAVFEINMNFGYGFPESIFSGYDTIISDALSTKEFEIGTIASLTENTAGDLYSRSPSVRIENPLVASYNRQDQIILLSEDEPSDYTIGEVVQQANTLAKGIVTSANTTNLFVRNISFNSDFVSGFVVEGLQSGAQHLAIETSYNTEVPIMGLNASIDNTVGTKDGVVKKLRVIDSGFGYQNDETVSLVGNNNTILGVASVINQGFSPGYWKSTNSHLNSEKKIHDNRYYQDFSYDIKSPINIEEYRSIVLGILHVAGSQFFGSVVKNTVGDPNISAETTVEQI